jgi:hypothetical protein
VAQDEARRIVMMDLTAVHRIHLGDLPTWLAVGGVALALREYARGKRDRRMDQAGQVSEGSAFTYEHLRGEDPHGEAEVVVHNANAVVMHDCYVDLMSWDDRTVLQQRVIGSLLPASHSGPIPFKNIPVPPRHAAGALVTSSISPRIRLVFTDGRGRRWSRTPDGRLKEIRRWS